MKKNNITITTVKNGPYVISNLKGIKESVGTNVPIDAPTKSFCRCGQSRTKPFCDGTHGKIDFKTDKSIDRQPRHSDTYRGKKITIHDDRGICSHAGYCTDGLPKVFRMGTEPWIDPDAESVEKVIETIKKCPSGALSYTIDDVKYDTYSDTPEVMITEDGPYVVKGSIELKDDDKPESMEHYALCRCGHSKNKPFCNGQHWYEKFEDDGKVKKKLDKATIDDEKYDNKYTTIQKLAKTGKSENSAMRTLETFPDFKTILFKGSQLHRMPLNGDIPVNLKTVIGKTAKKPITLNLPFYVSHMSFGALSREAKIALASGSAIVGTAMCSGEGGMLLESREAAKIYIYEQGTAHFSYDEEIMKKADAVELKIGQGVKPGLGGHLPASKITPEIRKIRGLKEGEESISPGRLAGVDSLEDLINRVDRIRMVTDGVPIGIKFAAGHIEEDIAFALQANPDFITIDCRGGATGSSPKFLKDNVGVPPIFAIRRARKYLDQVNSKVSLCITGGFRDSSDIAKGIALGADAIALATASMISIGCLQSKVCHTGTCPVGIATQDEGLRSVFNMEESIQHFVNFYTATANELEVFARTNGKNDIHQLDVDDLMTINNEVSLNTDIKHV
ncbi:glutamate synthase-related protein [Petrocella sp. FN5]|uniref:glutamate synthase-related protein n=1 Tax=Petrocella sp. FN5 TaxID=3032002 RepID=UPI0023DB7959|nr:glutamate synthase-related protein [Petrocella sp. FN5]MDF1617514.1 glutamate synthase-related protein [Petrocella sp. FN5]